MWSHSLTLSPHGLALSQGPSQISALIQQFMRLPSLSALSPSYCRDSVWTVKPAPCLAPGAVITTHHAASRHISCANAVSSPSYFFQNVFSIISWAWTFARAAKRHPSWEPSSQVSLRVTGTTDFQGWQQTAFLLSVGERWPSFPVKPQQFANQSGWMCFYLSKDLLSQFKKIIQELNSPSPFSIRLFCAAIPPFSRAGRRQQEPGVWFSAQVVGVSLCLASAQLSVNNASWQDFSFL